MITDAQILAVMPARMKNLKRHVEVSAPGVLEERCEGKWRFARQVPCDKPGVNRFVTRCRLVRAMLVVQNNGPIQGFREVM